MAQYDDADSVSPKHRFMTDPTAGKVIQSLTSMYHQAQQPDDNELENTEIPEISRNDRVLLIGGVYDLVDNILAANADDSSDEEDTDDEETAGFIELAKDKRMSAYYKAFMGKMRNLVEPWHGDKVKFLSMWAELGNELYNKSPADEPSRTQKLVAVNNDSEESAAVVGSDAALPAKLATNLTEMGFKPMPSVDKGDAAWYKSGASDGYPDKQVILIRRDDMSWVVMLSKVNKYGHYGKSLVKRVLGEETSADTIMRVIALLYDQISSDGT